MDWKIRIRGWWQWGCTLCWCPWQAKQRTHGSILKFLLLNIFIDVTGEVTEHTLFSSAKHQNESSCQYTRAGLPPVRMWIGLKNKKTKDLSLQEKAQQCTKFPREVVLPPSLQFPSWHLNEGSSSLLWPQSQLPEAGACTPALLRSLPIPACSLLQPEMVRGFQKMPSHTGEKALGKIEINGSGSQPHQALVFANVHKFVCTQQNSSLESLSCFRKKQQNLKWDHVPWTSNSTEDSRCSNTGFLCTWGYRPVSLFVL